MAFRNPESLHPSTLPNRKCPHATSEEALFVFNYASRREANRELTRPTFWETFRALFPEIETIPHMDTVNRLLEKIDPAKLEHVLLDTVKRLVRNGRLRSLMVDKRTVIAIDGTQNSPETSHGRRRDYSVVIGRSSGKYYYHGQHKTVWVYTLHRKATQLLTAPFLVSALEGRVGILDLNQGVIEQPGGLLQRFTHLIDVRKRRGVRHTWASVFAVATCAILSGADGFRAIGEWAQSLSQENLKKQGAGSAIQKDDTNRVSNRKASTQHSGRVSPGGNRVRYYEQKSTGRWVRGIVGIESWTLGN